MIHYDTAIVGGGPSGLAAAICSAELGAKTALLEAQPRTGRRLLSTGNGRCNITNTDISPSVYNTDCPSLLAQVLGSVSDNDYALFFEKAGIPFMTEDSGRVYPRAESAAAVLDLLRLRASALGVDEICSARVKRASFGNGKFLLDFGENMTCGSLVVAAGGCAAPQLGGCSDGMGLLESFGHTKTEPRPSLVPVRVRSPHMGAMKGTRIHCDIFLERDRKTVARERGELQFNENALSGVAVFNLSARLEGGDEAICADLLPDMTFDRAVKMLSARRNIEGLSKGDFLLGLFSKRPAQCVMKEAGTGDPGGRASGLSDRDIKAIASVIKKWRFPVTGTDSFGKAQVMRGGIGLSQFTNRLESKKRGGLYACGEVLDCDGPCGGYNLRWAFTSGMVAGKSAAERGHSK